MFCDRRELTALTGGLLVALSGHALAFEDTAWRLEPQVSTHWVELVQGTELSKLGASYRAGGFESATGQWVGFDKWYRPKWVDTRLAWMTQLSPEFGVLWGASTGERAEKYSIAPSLKLGFVYQLKTTSRSSFSIKATSVIGGRMKERTCTADYGDIGGVAQVHCRLAATEMTPAETLKLLTDTLPPDRNSVQIRYFYQF
jgi:hypothetical protein